MVVQKRKEPGHSITQAMRATPRGRFQGATRQVADSFKTPRVPAHPDTEES
jgi:hypothetical protein